ncbi:NAD-dependent succinate-semialdehyde dehydrogenase [Corynebacterium casei]|uniref:NAD-dependent succinate-semialdehyde dehydrogenase n=1 Tax=Corynebacterium casei TaxID=160386 RepID=UPI003F910BD2
MGQSESKQGELKVTYRVQTPMTDEVIETFPTATAEDIEHVLAEAHSAAKSWGALGIEKRAEIVAKIAELFDARKHDLGAIIAEEMGKPLAEGIEEAEFSADIFKYYADNGPSFAADEEIPTNSAGKAVIRRLPIGTLLGVMPWNFPYYQVARFAAPNLMLGNTIILKHAEICPRSALAIQQILNDAGVPQGVYNNVFASHDHIAEMIADPRIQGVSLTGSERAGAIIGEQAGKNLKKAVLELGGSDPYIVLDTKDVKAAAKLAWETRMYNTGQACNSNKRLIVMDDIYDEFVVELVALAQQMKPADPMQLAESTENSYAPLSSRSAAEGLAEQLKNAVQEGATVHVGGELAEDSAYFSPAVVTGIERGSGSYYEEFFGPIAVVNKVSSDEEALELANDSQFGLGGAVFSEDKARAEKIARQLDVGMSNVNTPAGEGAEIPFGGVKRSGFGRELGPLAMDEFVNKQMYFVAD